MILKILALPARIYMLIMGIALMGKSSSKLLVDNKKDPYNKLKINIAKLSYYKHTHNIFACKTHMTGIFHLPF
jgi:hypothetical protein